MSYFSYKARDLAGKTVSGLVEAPTKDAATKLLHDKQLFVVGLNESRGVTKGLDAVRLKRVGFGEIVNFTRQLATMVVAGLSLPEALNILKNQTQNETFQNVINEIENQIVAGGT